MAELSHSYDFLEFGEFRSHDDLGVTPLLLRQGVEREDLGIMTLDDAMEDGLVHFTKVTPHPGEPVRELMLYNASVYALLVLDGEELLDGGHKFIVNHAVLSRPKTKTPVSVTRVEKLAIDGDGPPLTPGRNLFFYTGRQSLAEHISEDLRYRGEWRAKHTQIEKAHGTMQGFSRDRASLDRNAGDGKDLSPAERLEGYVEPLALEPRQVGAIFHRCGRPISVEFVCSPALARSAWPKVIRSYALGTLNFNYGFYSVSPFNTAEEIFDCLKRARTWQASGAGYGAAVRYDQTPGLDGGEIYAIGITVHLSVFAVPGNQRAFRNLSPEEFACDRELAELITATEVRLDHVEDAERFMRHQIDRLNEELIDTARERRALTERYNELLDQLSPYSDKKRPHVSFLERKFGELPSWAPDPPEDED